MGERNEACERCLAMNAEEQEQRISFLRQETERLSPERMARGRRESFIATAMNGLLVSGRDLTQDRIVAKAIELGDSIIAALDKK